MMQRGCVLALACKASDAVHTITSGITAWRSTGSTAVIPSYLSYLAEAHADLRQFDNATRCIGEAMTAVELTEPGSLTPDPASTQRVAKACHEAGLLVLTAGTFGNVLRFLPPLVIGEDLLEEGLSILEDAFASV